ncbi:GGDEF domain-containing protein [bacterium]|nr:GGDEF domain-containing protein [bacterium]MBU1989981.1 GGDEF domain-containing protein [bacterium]
MGLPIFALVIALISNTLISTYENLHISFYIESVLLLAFSIYFIFYLIYNGFDVKITDEVSKTFTREYLYSYLKNEIKREKEYTLVLITIDNLNDINNLYGIKNGDKTILHVAKWVSEYLVENGMNNFPIGHIKGGDFVLGLKGFKGEYNTLLELMFLKCDDFKVNEIEVKISGSIIDTSFSNELEYLIEKLFELQDIQKNSKIQSVHKDMNPSELEGFVINAIKQRKFIIMSQDVFEDTNSVLKECFIKLKAPDGKLIHQKSYLKVINKLGLMLDFDMIILEMIIYNCMKNSNEIFAVSISPTSLRNKVFYEKVKELLANNKHAKNRIMFILSESEYYPQIQRYNSLLQSLKDQGILITIDRLGAVETSFLYLRDLEIDCVRFDPLYTKEIKKIKYNSIISGFNLIAHSSGVKSWIKMLEDEEIKMLAKEIKIDYLQGKYLAPLEKIYES